MSFKIQERAPPPAGSAVLQVELASGLGAPRRVIMQWATGESVLHPAMRKHVLKWIQEWKYLCMCPKKCDCQNPYPDDWNGIDGVWHISEMCPKHNRKPLPDPECPMHN